MRPQFSGELAQIEATAFWKAYNEKLNMMLANASRGCELAKDLPDIKSHQGEVRALRSVKELPDYILKHIDENPEKG